MASAQGDRQAAVRALTSTLWSYNGDYSALFDAAGIPAGDWNGRFLQWLNTNAGTTYTNVNDAMAYVAAANGATNFSAMSQVGTVIASPLPLPTPVLIESFDADNFTKVGAGATFALDTVNKVEGTGSMQATGPASNVTTGLDRTYGTYTFDNLGTIAFYVDPVSDASRSNITLSIFVNATSQNNSGIGNSDKFQKGGRWYAFHASQYGTLLGLGPGSLRLRYLLNMASPFSGSVRFDGAYTNANGRPTLVITGDDCYLTHYTDLHPMLAARGMKASFSVPPSLLGSGTSNLQKMTLTELQALYAYGHDLFCDSTMDDSNTDLVSTSNALDGANGINAVRSYLVSNGFTRAKDHFCWTGGLWNQATVDAFKGAGFLFGRTTEPAPFYDRFGAAGILPTIPSQGFTSAATASTMLGWIDFCITAGLTIVCHIHDMPANDSPSAIGVKKSVMTTILDYAATKRNAGLLDVLTVSQWYARQAAGVVGV